MTHLTEKDLLAAIAHLRNPHRLESDRHRMDLLELGARRLLAWLERHGYRITKQ